MAAGVSERDYEELLQKFDDLQTSSAELEHELELRIDQLTQERNEVAASRVRGVSCR
jgi:hypothetical protein